MFKQRRLVPQSYVDFKAFVDSMESEEPEDVATIREWLELKPIDFFRQNSVEQIKKWMADNLVDDLALLKAEKSVQESLKSAYGLSSESDLEDAYNWVDASDFQGSEKQIAWAKSIAHKHHDAIVRAWKQGKKIPTKASWWIDNRSNIVVNLPL